MNFEVIRIEFGKIGTSETDLEQSLRILSTYLLLENGRYDRSTIGNAYRITPAGRYYLRYLAGKFSYLDLVCQDTPVWDVKTFDTIKELIHSTDLEDRFKRVGAFVNHLAEDEKQEHAAILSTPESIPLRGEIMTTLKSDFEGHVRYIRKNRTRLRVEKTPNSAKE